MVQTRAKVATTPILVDLAPVSNVVFVFLCLGLELNRDLLPLDVFSLCDILSGGTFVQCVDHLVGHLWTFIFLLFIF